MSSNRLGTVDQELGGAVGTQCGPRRRRPDDSGAGGAQAGCGVRTANCGLSLGDPLRKAAAWFAREIETWRSHRRVPVRE